MTIPRPGPPWVVAGSYWSDRRHRCSEKGDTNDSSRQSSIGECGVPIVTSATDTAESGVVQETGTTFRLIYRSRSLLPDKSDGGDEALAEILRVARHNNNEHDVTGALVLYEYKKRFAQVLEGPENKVRSLFDSIQRDSRHDNVEIRQEDSVPNRIFRRWAMALVLEHREQDVPLVATSGGVSEASPWRVSPEQEAVLTQLRDLTRGYGRAS